MRRITYILLLTFVSLGAMAQREVYNLNRDWNFSYGWDMNVANGGTQVELPHTWNHDALGGKADYYRGMGSYTKIIEPPRGWKDKKVFIRFAGVGTVCDVYVGGRHVGQHRGGYTGFAFEITNFLTFGERNTIWVRVSNAQNLDVAPISGEFNVYGGIYRDVELIVLPKTHLAVGGSDATALHVTPMNVTDLNAQISAVATIEGTSDEMVFANFTLSDQDGRIIDSSARRIQLGFDGRNSLAATFNVNNPRLWNSTADPYLYRVSVKISGGMNSSDSLDQTIGFRYFTVDENNRFLLNGKQLRIQGVSRVEDYALLGKALYRENQRRDIELMREMGVNAVRMAYYPHDPYFFDLCDAAGIMVWCDVPLAASPMQKGYNDSQTFRENVMAQSREMVGQLYNHPSIIIWGLYSNLMQRGDDPVPFLRELRGVIEDIDESRLTSAASNQDGDLNFVTDLIGFDQMMGWSSGLPSDVDGWGRQLRRDWPKLKSGLSQYGAGANIYQQSDTLLKPAIAGPWHPESWQTHLHQEYWKVISTKSYFWGTFAWSMFDYGMAWDNKGSQPGVADFGLVTFDRAVRKDAFYFYKANWNHNDPFVYITQRRWQERSSPRQTITVFSNQSDVELIVNGASLGQQPNSGMGSFVWKNITLRSGDNTIEAVDRLSGKSDKTTITILPRPVLIDSQYGANATRNVSMQRK